MSSRCSPQRPEGLTALGAAAVHVAENSLFACAEPCDTPRTVSLLQARPDAEPWLTAAVAFTGTFEGVVRVALPSTLAADLAGAFCGVRPQSLGPADVADFTGELTNIVCGLWLTQTHRNERFTLAAPVVEAAAPADLAAMAAADPGALGIALNDTPVLVALAAGTPVARS